MLDIDKGRDTCRPYLGYYRHCGLGHLVSSKCKQIPCDTASSNLGKSLSQHDGKIPRLPYLIHSYAQLPR